MSVVSNKTDAINIFIFFMLSVSLFLRFIIITLLTVSFIHEFLLLYDAHIRVI